MLTLSRITTRRDQTRSVVGVLLLCAVLLSGCTNSPPRTSDKPTDPQSNTINYVDAVHGIKIEYPADWVEQPTPVHTSVVLSLQLPTDGKTLLPPSFLIATQDSDPTSPDMTLDSITRQLLNKAQQQFDEFSLLGNVQVMVSGEPGRRIIYKGKSNIVALQTLCVITIHQGKGYALSYAADPSTFDAGLLKAEQTISNFKFTK